MSPDKLFESEVVAVKESDHCRTPEWLYKALDMEFAFDLDPCPLDLAPSVNGLMLNWDDKHVFCNPPYSSILPWVEKAISSRALTVFLVPARFDARWCRHLREAKAEFRFFARDFRFEGISGGKPRPVGGAMIVILNRLYP